MSNMDTMTILKSAIDDINALILQGVVNWKHATNAVGKIGAVIDALEKQKTEKEAAYNAAIEDARKKRELAKAEAAERGEEILGGETVFVDLTSGEQKTIIE